MERTASRVASRMSTQVESDASSSRTLPPIRTRTNASSAVIALRVVRRPRGYEVRGLDVWLVLKDVECDCDVHRHFDRCTADL